MRQRSSILLKKSCLIVCSVACGDMSTHTHLCKTKNSETIKEAGLYLQKLPLLWKCLHSVRDLALENQIHNSLLIVKMHDIKPFIRYLKYTLSGKQVRK